MKLKINKQTIEIVLWLLGQLITVLRQISKDNKGSEDGNAFARSAHNVNDLRKMFIMIKQIKNLESHEQKEIGKDAKGN